MDGVAGFVGGAFWKGKTLCPSGILFTWSFHQFSQMKGSEAYLPPLNQRSHSPNTRMYAPSAHKATSFNEERNAQSEILPRESLRPTNSAGPIVSSSHS